MQITINNAVITLADGTTQNATIKGDAELTPEPGTGDPHPSHPILLPPTSDNPEVIFILSFCPNPPPPHWEWIGFLPGEDVPERPTPEPRPEPPTDGIGIVKPPPADGGWGWYPGYGWVYYPGPGEASPKKKR